MLPVGPGPGGARPPNAFGLLRTRLVTTSLVLLCARVISLVATALAPSKSPLFVEGSRPNTRSLGPR